MTCSRVYAQVIFVGHIAGRICPVFLGKIGCFESSTYAVDQCAVEAFLQAILFGRIPLGWGVVAVEFGEHLLSGYGEILPGTVRDE